VVLKSTSVKEIVVQGRKVIQIDAETGVYEGFQILLQNNILSAPVYDSSTHTYTGFLDIRDLISFVVFVNDSQKITSNTQLEDLIKHGQAQFKTATTDGVTLRYLSRRNVFRPIETEGNLYQVCELLAVPGVHRVPVVENGQVVSIISQTTIMMLLAKKVPSIVNETKSGHTIKQLGLGTSPVLSVKKTESVINTFRKMEKQQKSGIAIVDNTGRLVSTTTGKDLGLFIKNPSMQALHNEIFEYLKIIRQQQIDIKSPCITVFSSDTVAKAVNLIAATRVHRIFVVDGEESFSPVAVLSITDILKFLEIMETTNQKKNLKLNSCF